MARAAIVALASLALAAPAGAQRVHVLIVTGLPGEPRFTTSFHAAASALYDTARQRWSVADSSLVYLADDPAVDTTRIAAGATRETVAQSLLGLSRRAQPGDVVFVFLLGHGSGAGPESRLSLRGPDATAADFATWLAGFRSQTLVLIHGGSASGDFVDALAGPRRVIVTATRSAAERNETVFADHYVRGVSGAADADKDGRTTVREAFDYARQEVARVYDAENRLLTEHARMSDSVLAATITLEATAPAASDPRIAALLAERRALEAQVQDLRARKNSMDATAYEQELERLLLAIAARTQAIRAAEGRP